MSKFIENLRNIVKTHKTVNIFLSSGVKLVGEIIYCDDSVVVIVNNQYNQHTQTERKTHINPIQIASYEILE